MMAVRHSGIAFLTIFCFFFSSIYVLIPTKAEAAGIIVRTIEELENAKNKKVENIIVEGELAQKVKDGENIASLGTITFMAIGAAILAAPLTGGASLPIAAASISISTGVGITMILAIIFVGSALLFAIYKDYSVIEFSTEPLRLKLRKN